MSLDFNDLFLLVKLYSKEEYDYIKSSDIIPDNIYNYGLKE